MLMAVVYTYQIPSEISNLQYQFSKLTLKRLKTTWSENVLSLE